MNKASIQGGFWADRLNVNAHQAIFHQWEQLEASGCIENFRIAAGEPDGFREGWFFADSDAYKWMDAASKIWATTLDPQLEAVMDGFIALLKRCQSPDGYCFTYNQIHFPGTRWANLQIEHELYCHGHLIEAGVSHYLATGREDMIAIARRAANRIVIDFKGKGPAYTPGHEEIEIALIRLHQFTPGDISYLQMARQFIEQRGRIRLFPLSIYHQNKSASERSKYVQQQKKAYLETHPHYRPFQLPPGNYAKKPSNSKLRWYVNALSGKYFQQHAPVRSQTVPAGHAVRFAYLETATAMLARESGDRSLLPALEKAWERMVTRRMYITGGIGAVPGLEGFGRDDELDPEYAYAETCAALGSIFWNWEMGQITGEAKFSDLIEWQLYNAALVGMGLDGTNYLYNNPLACRGGVTRKPWYAVPCCPSNLSRTLANISQYQFSSVMESGVIKIHQYMSSDLYTNIKHPKEDHSAGIRLQMTSGFPWEGITQVRVTEISGGGINIPAEFTIQLRLPSWASETSVLINGKAVENDAHERNLIINVPAAGFDPRKAVFLPLSRQWSAGDVIDVKFSMPVRLRQAPARVREYANKVAVTRGPIVYCLESTDNPGVNLFSARLDPDSLHSVYDPDLLGGIHKIQGKTTDGFPLVFIPYFLWGNRGSSQMTVWVNV